jgi:hypothetical protein
MGKPGAGANASCSGWDLRFKRRRLPPGRRPHKYLRAGLADLCSEARQGSHSCRSEESVQTLRPEGATGPGRSFGRNTNGVRAARYRGHLVGSSDGQNGEEVLTERAYELSGTASRSSWWLVAKNGDGPLQVLTLDDGDTLPVFSGEGEAELFLWLREAREHGWGGTTEFPRGAGVRALRTLLARELRDARPLPGEPRRGGRGALGLEPRGLFEVDDGREQVPPMRSSCLGVGGTGAETVGKAGEREREGTNR